MRDTKAISKANYEAYKKHGICPQCGVNRAAPHRVRCEECLLKNAESRKKAYDKKTAETKEQMRVRHRAYVKQLREERKSKGLCIYCEKPLSRNSTCFCVDCRIKNQRNNDRRKQDIDKSERPIYGICYICGKKPIVKGKKLCTECLERSMRGLQIANTSEKTIERRNYIRNQNNAIFCNQGKEKRAVGTNYNV